MKIRTRLIMAFIIIIGFPILLIATTTGTIMYYTVNTVNKYYGVETTTTQILTNPNYLVVDAINGLYEEIKEVIEESPDKLLDSSYADELNQKLEKKASFLVVFQEDNAVYVGDDTRYNEIKRQVLEVPRYSYSEEDDSGLYFDDNEPFLLRKTEFTYSGGENGSIYIVTNIETFLPQVKASCINLAICILGIIFFTAIVLVAWLYQSLVRPLNVLRMGIYCMKNGDLDFEMKADSDDEIGQICDDFEDMRKQVKRLMEERLEYEEQMKTLISNISHDLKTPITAIKGYAEGILDGVAESPEKRDKYLRTIYTKANDMTYLVDELSFYSKIDTNKIPYNFVKVNLDQYFSDCINDMNLDLEVKQIELIYENHADKEIEVIVDVEQLKRVINNIIGNSVKYMDKEHGLITVFIESKDEMIQVTFRDNGKGVAKEDLKKIFERFYRTDQSRNSTKPGSGLGLAIAKKIINDHGGDIWAEGELGVGTSIIFTLKKYNEEDEDTFYRIDKDANKAMTKVKN